MSSQEKDFRDYPQRNLTFAYGHDLNGREGKQLAGAAGKGSDAQSVGGIGSIFVAAVSLTQAQYDALSVKDSATLYVIVG
jgi:hypothetical protein